jgi:AcrR family transcriptional regulator
MAQPRTNLSRAAILDCALALADAEGLEAVGIRRLARELGVTPMALYWHFADKQQLLHALGDRLLAGLELSGDAAAPWPARLRAVVGSLMGVLRAHPSAAVLIGALPTAASEHALDATEVLLEILGRAGFSPEEAVHVTTQIVRATTSIVAAELGADVLPGDDEPARVLREVAGERHPRVAEVAGLIAAPEEPDAFYELALELILGGVEAAAARRASD